MSQIIVFETAAGLSVVIPTGETPIDEVIARDVPAWVVPVVMAREGLPKDRLFRSAWKMKDGAIIEDLEKAKDVAHAMRRADRSKKMAPLDIEATIKAKAAAAEAARETIRQQNAGIQSRIDAAQSVETLRAELAGLV